MSDIPLNPRTGQAIRNYLINPGQSVAIVGQKWLAKIEIATFLAEQLLDLNSGQLASCPYFLNIGNNQLNTVTIDEIREINNFILLKVPLKRAVSRIIIIQRAERMTPEAQNALLKNLEEPPKDTVFILTAESTESLLPTIVSRLSIINAYKPSASQLSAYFKEQGSDDEQIKQALLIADSLPGLMKQLLSDEEAPIREALALSRKLLSSSRFEKLNLAASISKDKTQVNNIFFIIKQMAKIGVGSTDQKSALKWQRILSSTLLAEKRLKANVQVKLLLTNYVLSIS